MGFERKPKKMAQQRCLRKACFERIMKKLIILQSCIVIINATKFSTYVFPNYVKVEVEGEDIGHIHCVGCVSSKAEPRGDLTEQTTLKQM